MQPITIILDDFGASAEVKGEARRGSITTHGAGHANITHYSVTLAGHEVDGTWADDARYNTTVRLTESHPLHAVATKISKAQELLRQFRAMLGKTPIGWREDEYRDAKQETRWAYYAAKREVEADPAAVALLAGEPMADV